MPKRLAVGLVWPEEEEKLEKGSSWDTERHGDERVSDTYLEGG